MTLLEEFSARARGSVQFARAQLGKVRQLFAKKEEATPAQEAANPPAAAIQERPEALKGCEERPLQPPSPETRPEALLERIFDDETELHCLRKRLEREREAQQRQELEEKIKALTASKLELEKRLAEQKQNHPH